MHLSLSLCYPLRLCLCVVLSLSEVNKGSIALITGTQPLLYFWVSLMNNIDPATLCLHHAVNTGMHGEAGTHKHTHTAA